MKITTAGESHGKGLVAIIEGLPAGLTLDLAAINAALSLRQSGYGRGARQKLEKDRAEIISGVRNLKTLGSPLTLFIENRDYANWADYMAPEGCDESARRLTKVRPGHADLTGMKKFGQTDARNILERASARETAVRVAAGEVCRQLLGALGVEVTGFVRSVGTVDGGGDFTFEDIKSSRGANLLMMKNERAAMKFIDECGAAGDTCGGVLELRVKGLKSGFGSCMTYAQKLDARLVSALMSVQAVKGAEVGLGFETARLRGSEAHDELYLKDGKIVRKTNRAGGIEGGMSNGEELILRAAMKPIPTLMKGLCTVDTDTVSETRAATERSDVCAIAACEVVLESALLLELCAVVLERLGGDTMQEIVERYGRLPS